MARKKTPRLSCKSAEHYTPPKYVEAARYVLGAIDLDPASCADANQIVGAARYFDRRIDGLRQPWAGRVFLNPPGDKRGKSVPAFWRKANEHVMAGDATVLWVGYSLEQLRTLQSCPDIGSQPCPSPVEYPLAFPRERIEFIEGGKPVAIQLGFLEMGIDDEAIGGGIGCRRCQVPVKSGPNVVGARYL